MHIRTFLKPLSFLPALLLMYMIYSFSAQEGNVSSSVSYKASCIIVEAADQIFDLGLDGYQVSYYATKINGVTRKLAHMTEYFLLAIAVSFPLYVYGLHGILLMLLAGGLCVAFACSDEYHQSFVSGRSPSAKDVAIDSFGIFIGIIMVRIIGWTGRMTIFRPLKKKEPKLSRKQKKQLQQQEYSGEYPGMYGIDPAVHGGDPRVHSGDAVMHGRDPRKHSTQPGQNGPYNTSYPPYGAPYPPGQGIQNYPSGQNMQDYPPNQRMREYPPGQGMQNYPGSGSSPYYGTPYGAPGNGQYGGYPYPIQSPQYEVADPEADISSDELSEDMPLAHLMRHRKSNQNK